jgi:diguanylate cyclase (GGDEF)-like protein/PAS domain S-box-containing protein
LSGKSESTFEQIVRNDGRLRIFNDTVPVGILVLRIEDGEVVFSNRLFHEILGADGDQILGASWDQFFVDPAERQNMMVKFVEENEIRNFEVQLNHVDGGIVWGLTSMSAIPIENEDLLLFAFIDVTPLKEAEAKIQALANYDALTELPSRRLFSDRLKMAMERATRAGSDMALMFIDLDDFKVVNDTLGHDAGDFVLKETANRLKNCVRKPDTVARIGGDEFVVVIEHQNVAHATIVGERIVNSLKQEIKSPDGTVTIGASIGVAFFPGNGKSEKELLRAADKAMYNVKGATKGTIGFL